MPGRAEAPGSHGPGSGWLEECFEEGLRAHCRALWHDPGEWGAWVSPQEAWEQLTGSPSVAASEEARVLALAAREPELLGAAERVLSRLAAGAPPAAALAPVELEAELDG